METLCFHYLFFLAFLSLIFINGHASIKKPVKLVDYVTFHYKMLTNIFDLNKKSHDFCQPCVGPMQLMCSQQRSVPKRNKLSPGFILLQAYKKLSLFMAILAKQIMTFLIIIIIFI